MNIYRKREPWGRFIIKTILVVALIMLTGMAFASRFRIGIDSQQNKCLPNYTFFLIDLKDKELKKGAIYSFSAKGMAPFFEDDTQIVKILIAKPGDFVEINESSQVVVNGEIIAEGLSLANKLMIPESHFIGKTVLKDGNYWFIGESTDSYDSRYWGSVKDEQIIGRAYPLY